MQARSAHPWSPTLVGVLTLVVLFAVIEALIRAGLINQYIVPPPSQILLAFPRMVTEEHILDRFLTTAGEAALAVGQLPSYRGVHSKSLAGLGG